jgi:hypothetical protein
LQAALIKAKKSEIIIEMVGAMYILSIIPFLLSGAGLPTITRISLVILPALGAAGLFLFSISRHPSFSGIGVVSGDDIILRDIEQHQTREMSLLSGLTGGVYSYMDIDWNNISDSRASFEPAIRCVKLSRSYSNRIQRTYRSNCGYQLQLVAGVLIGALFGIITATDFKTFNVEKLPEAIGVGVLAGLLIFSVLFI